MECMEVTRYSLHHARCFRALIGGKGDNCMSNSNKTTISFVIPCYKSEYSIGLVIDEIIEVVSKRPEFDYQIIAVNDCSPDNVLSEIRSYAESNPRIIGIDLAKNSGRHAALMCGCRYATGDYIVFSDDDQQCPMDRLWDLLAPLINNSTNGGGYDVSIARYPKKTQSLWKNFGSRINDIISTWLTIY